MPVSAQDLINTHKIPATYRQLHYWTSCGYLTPIRNEMPGSGKNLKYTDTEAEVATVMAHLVAFGLAIPRAAEIARQLITSATRSLHIQVNDGTYGHLAIWMP